LKSEKLKVENELTKKTKNKSKDKQPTHKQSLLLHKR